MTTAYSFGSGGPRCLGRTASRVAAAEFSLGQATAPVGGLATAVFLLGLLTYGLFAASSAGGRR